MLGLVNTSQPITQAAKRLPMTPLQKRLHWLAWKARCVVSFRYREWPVEVLLFVCAILAKIVPGFNMPTHGRLYATVFRSHLEGLQAVGMDHEWCYFTRNHDKQRVRIPRTEAIGRGWFEVVEYGLVGVHLIVTAGKNYAASCFDNTAEAENLKYHGFGSSSTAVNAADTGLTTEYTTEYVTNSTRPTGSQAHSNATYTTVGTFSPDSGTPTVQEWGLFSASSSTTLYDHQLTGGQALTANADSLQVTYVLTLS